MKINNDAIKKIQECKNVAIFTHINPDGDCLGSASALKEALVSLNKNCDIYCDSPIAENYLFIKHMNNVNKKTCNEYDLLISVDCSDAKRMGCYGTEFKKHNNTIKFDHHATIEEYAKINITEIVSSTCLMIYFYLKALNIQFNKDIACALYSGISSDTGCFMHNNTTYLEHEVATELIKYNFDLENANNNLYKYCTINKFNLLKKALNNTKFYLDNKIGITTIKQNDLKETNALISDTTGIVNYVINVNNVMVGMIIYEEKPGLFKCSMRSKGNIDVSELANMFGGGGHKYASGCNIFGNANTVKKKLLLACEKLLHN